MTTEEKAKAYDIALEGARKELGVDRKEWEVVQRVLHNIFPELAESEDERIRKTLIEELSACETVGELKFRLPQPTRDEVLAWLEKQKEQKPSINIDQLKSLMLQYLQEAANEKDDSSIEADTDKWARKILGYDFEQKPTEWSEEDEKMKERLITRLNWITYNTRTDGTSPNITFFDEIEWLKSLRPSWKPSKEQMKALQCAIVFMEIRKASDYDITPLKLLYEHLKKLM